MASLGTIEISPRAARRLRAGHVWVYKSDLRRKKNARGGELVHLVARHRSGGTNPVGTAFFNPKSLISLRLITRKPVDVDTEFWGSRIQRALELRAKWGNQDTAGRLVYSEADGLPGLIVDRYDDVLVMQTLCSGAERLKEEWAGILGKLISPSAIIERNDSAARKLEGLPDKVGILRGSLAGPVEILEGGLRFLVDPLAGQKTGYYLDQRENRIRAADYARGRCLDVFSYQGGFGLHLMRGGAGEVTLVDQSEQALQVAQAAARLNKFQVRVQAVNAFDFLKKQQTAGERYQTIVLDPPAFVKNRDAIERAARGYKEINLRAMRLLEEGGILITSSCSYHMQPEHFEELVLDAARDAGRVVQLLERRSQARDHPERLGFPESRYLKCFILRVL